MKGLLLFVIVILTILTGGIGVMMIASWFLGAGDPTGWQAITAVVLTATGWGLYQLGLKVSGNSGFENVEHY